MRISQKVAVGVVFVAALFMTILDATIVNVALPTIGRDFNVSPTALDAISISFLVSLAIFIPASGWDDKARAGSGRNRRSGPGGTRHAPFHRN